MAPIRPTSTLNRRALLRRSALAGGGLLAGALVPARGFAQASAPAVITSERMRPTLPSGVQAGDLSGDRAMLWAQADRPARLLVEWATTESFADARLVQGPAALEDADFTAKLDLDGLPAGPAGLLPRAVRRSCGLEARERAGRRQLLDAARHPPEPPLRLVGRYGGQGWGINLDWGGMKIYEAMRAVEPAFFIHSGDTIYADGPFAAEQALPDGSVWKNLTTEATSKVAETLAEFRGNYAYNLMDANLRRFNAEVPMLVQWDDHEVLNNWYPHEDLASDPKKAVFKVKSVDLLAARAAQAFFDYMPIREHPLERKRVYGSFSYGPSLEVFRLDMRSYRGPNSKNDQTVAGPDTAFLGAVQVRWLQQALLASKATWKVIAADMPIGLVVPDDGLFEAIANGDGPARGRELEIAGLLRFIRDAGIRNVVWLTADVHYTAAHYYDPNAAQFQEFAPFWEFVSGPLHAGTFGPNPLDDTFGPKVVFQKAPPAGQANLAPSAGLQFFGQVDIDGASEVMTVTLKDLAGTALFTQELMPEA